MSRFSQRSFFRRVVRALLPIAQAIWKWILFPIKLLFLPAQFTELLHDRGVKVEGNLHRKKRHKRRWWIECLSAPFRLIALPAVLIRQAVRRGRARQLLYFTPAVVVVLLSIFVWYQVSFRSERIQQRYFLGAQNAASAGNHKLAKTYFQRLRERQALSAEQTLIWARFLQQTGDELLAQDLIDSIAPPSASGYPPAHAYQAIQLAQRIDESVRQSPSEKPSPSDLQRLKSHLSYADDLNKDIPLAWATYYTHSQEIEKAIQSMEKIAQRSPQLYLSIAKLIDEYGLDSQLAQEARFKAMTRLKSQLKEDPLNHTTRLHYARSLIQLERFTEAQAALYQGLKIQHAPELRRGLADFFVVLFDRLSAKLQDNTDVSQASLIQQYDLLRRAINADPDYILPYSKLVNWLLQTQGKDPFSNPTGTELAADRSGTAGQADPAENTEFSTRQDQSQPATESQRFAGEKIRQALEILVTSDAPQAIDQASLGYLDWIAGKPDSGRWLLGQAFGMDEEFGRLGNRLALVHAFHPAWPNHQWALELAKRSVDQAPEVAGYQQSYGMVLLQAGKTEQGINVLKECVDRVPFPADAHQALADAYFSIGKYSLAEFHSNQRASIKNRELMKNF